MSERNLTDEDVKAVAREVVTELKDELTKDFGRGVMSHIWKVLITIALTLTAYGAGAGKIGGQ
jgi:hypothetical protein